MPVRQRPDALLTRRLRRLARHVPGALELRPEDIHRARVASRRLRELLPLFEGCLPRRRLKRARRRVRRITRTLGAARELDVALETFDEAAARAWPAGCETIARVRESVIGERDAAREWMRHRLAPFDAGRLARKLAVALGTVPGRSEEEPPPWQVRLAARVRRRAEELEAAVEAAGGLYLPDRLHGVRLAVKKLRYALELADESGSAAAGAQARDLKRIQDTLGRLHDLEVVAARVKAALGAIDPHDAQGAAALEAMARVLEGAGRKLHARYLSRRNALLAIAAAARGFEGTPRADEPAHA